MQTPKSESKFTPLAIKVLIRAITSSQWAWIPFPWYRKDKSWARTEYLGEQRGLLGFNSLNSLGLGFELDSSKYDIFITRTRLVARYMFSHNTSGYSLGLAMSF